jgi:hypothetical protein
MFVSSMEKATQHLDLLREIIGTSSHRDMKLAIAATALQALPLLKHKILAYQRTTLQDIVSPYQTIKQPSAGAHRPHYRSRFTEHPPGLVGHVKSVCWHEEW